MKCKMKCLLKTVKEKNCGCIASVATPDVYPFSLILVLTVAAATYNDNRAFSSSFSRFMQGCVVHICLCRFRLIEIIEFIHIIS